MSVIYIQLRYSLIVIPREQNKSDGEVHLDGVSSRAEPTSYKQLEIRQTWVWNYGFFGRFTGQGGQDAV